MRQYQLDVRIPIGDCLVKDVSNRKLTRTLDKVHAFHRHGRKVCLFSGLTLGVKMKEEKKMAKETGLDSNSLQNHGLISLTKFLFNFTDVSGIFLSS